MGGYVRAMQQYAVFRGRASRGEFWPFAAVMLALTLVALALDTATGQGTEKSPGGVLTALVILAHLIPSYAVTARRLHDTDRSGWMILLVLIPLVGLVLVVFACLRGTPGPNHYGPDPLIAPGVIGNRGMPAAEGPALSPVAPAASGRVDVIAELERLGRLRREGHLSEAEFEVMKAETLTKSRS
ncbi:DUF805 domain-containing protein [Methylobacterium sp. J-067]|uniref:DUF805 domain-containing protein n=1 Tax=Methylobacterium sp. J-067 TaxID=2836648 RepID=UPI001FB9A4D1|nr:DUF805 domain-containing protein [Methylobacterium sp. J-067]